MITSQSVRIATAGKENLRDEAVFAGLEKYEAIQSQAHQLEMNIRESRESVYAPLWWLV